MSIKILSVSCLDLLATLPPKSIQCCVTSPPYWGLRDYGSAGQLGLEKTPELYVANLVAVFRGVREALRDDGILWLNLGDSYAAGGRGASDSHRQKIGANTANAQSLGTKKPTAGMKEKDLVGIPWMVAFALRADGWYLRSDIIWEKPNPMPESVTDRPTKAHEYIFLLSKSQRYFYDADAIREPLTDSSIKRLAQETFDTQTGGPKDYGTTGENPNRSCRKVLENVKKRSGNKERKFRADHGGNPALSNNHLAFGVPWEDDGSGRNARSVWTIATQPFSGAHFATFPPRLAEKCILAGSSPFACETCGAPFVRVRELVSREIGGGSPAVPRENRGWFAKQQGQSQSDREGLTQSIQRTTGWMASCDHDCEGSGKSMVLDPFGGAGTSGLVADRLGRDATLIELNPDYVTMARNRISDDAPLFSEVSE